ncbi:MAG: hypothetical protein R2712_28255 [Vicinamibacterales bacterium]
MSLLRAEVEEAGGGGGRGGVVGRGVGAGRWRAAADSGVPSNQMPGVFQNVEFTQRWRNSRRSTSGCTTRPAAT